MENLIQLVTDALARHGIEAPSAIGQAPADPGPKPLPQSLELLPQHSFPKSPAEDPAP